MTRRRNTSVNAPCSYLTSPHTCKLTTLWETASSEQPHTQLAAVNVERVSAAKTSLRETCVSLLSRRLARPPV
jgi:hypothetical protein